MVESRVGRHFYYPLDEQPLEDSDPLVLDCSDLEAVDSPSRRFCSDFVGERVSWVELEGEVCENSHDSVVVYSL